MGVGSTTITINDLREVTLMSRFCNQLKEVPWLDEEHRTESFLLCLSAFSPQKGWETSNTWNPEGDY